MTTSASPPPASPATGPGATPNPELSILIPALNEEGNIGELIARCRAVLEELGLSAGSAPDARVQILVVDGGSSDRTVEEAREAGARTIEQVGPGYGGALRTGFASSPSRYVLTMDSDLSHEPEFIAQLWAARETADLVIASRYVPGGKADMSMFRLFLSRILNVFFTTALSIPVKDISSGYRLYRREVLARIDFRAADFDVLEEILILIYNQGGRLAEVPFHYRARKTGKSHAKLFRFGLAYCRTFFAMWRLRRKKG